MMAHDLGYRDASLRGVREALAFWERSLLEPFYVYFIQEHSGGPVKIGRARHPAQRLLELQCGNPRALTLRAVLIARPTAEGALHRSFEHYRGIGEWFDGGLAEVITAAAQHISAEQMQRYGDGEPLPAVMDRAESLIFREQT